MNFSQFQSVLLLLDASEMPISGIQSNNRLFYKIKYLSDEFHFCSHIPMKI